MASGECRKELPGGQSTAAAEAERGGGQAGEVVACCSDVTWREYPDIGEALTSSIYDAWILIMHRVCHFFS